MFRFNRARAGISRLEFASEPGVVAIIDDVKLRGEAAVLEWGIRFGDIAEGAPYVISRDLLQKAFEELPEEQRALLQRVASRIRNFAEAQKSCLTDFSISIPGGKTGHTVSPVRAVGCYAPGGRFPLPSSVLMTVIPARVASVSRICVASPRPPAIVLAAAYIAGADEFLAIGGAQAIAAMAFGAGQVKPCDMIVGPGNRYVTAAKKYLYGQVGIDMLAGPSDLMIVADDLANPVWIAADLLAQAEHDVEAKPILVALNEAIISKVEFEIDKVLNPKSVSAKALQNGFATVVTSIEEAALVANTLAPEHLQLCFEDAAASKQQFTNYGALFVGENSAEIFGDYGFGPNHTLPTGGSARFTAGLNVMSFLRVQTFLQIDNLEVCEEAANDARMLAECEGLVGHARASALRIR